MRSTITIAPLPKTNPPKYVAYFGDLAANVHALDARTGEELWMVKVDKHPLARVTGSTKFYENRLYVPVTSLEEAGGAEVTYQCCTFRGNVVALNATTGKQIWKTYTIQQKLQTNLEKRQRRAAIWPGRCRRVGIANPRPRTWSALRHFR